MENDQTPLKQTPLYAAAVAAGGRMVAFGGWEMAVQFAGIRDEHRAVREQVGIFDISHMGQIAVEGEGGAAFLDYLLPANVRGLQTGQMLYAPMCNEKGGCVDDVVLYRLGPSSHLLVVNAGRLEVDWAWMNDRAAGWGDCQLLNLSDERGMVAVQGPRAEDLMGALTDRPVADLGYYQCRSLAVAGTSAIISRNGYTGEDGFEITCAAGEVAQVWAALLAAGAQPCGLGARDTLRTEMGFCLYGHELDEDTTPLEAGLGWTLDLGKDVEFIGAQSLRELREQGVGRRLRGFQMSARGIPRAGYAIVDGDGQAIGQVTSGTQSPTLDRGIGLGFLDRGWDKIGGQIHIEMRGKSAPAEVVKTPFVPSGVKKN